MQSIHVIPEEYTETASEAMDEHVHPKFAQNPSRTLLIRGRL